MTYFLYKLISPRTTFPQDITSIEMKILQEHVVYWKELTDKKIVLLFGPVADPKGTYGLALRLLMKGLSMIMVFMTLRSKLMWVLNLRFILCLK